MRKRGYSRAFRPADGVGKRYLIDNIPAELWRDVRHKAAREGTSLRALILTLLERWSSSPEGGGLHVADR